MTGHIVVLITAPSLAEAERLASLLVEERLAACVNLVGPVESVYRWQGAVTRDREILLVVKTSGSRYEALERKVREVHPYELPEIVALPVSRGLPAYLAWIDAETSG